jgi:hypothetical protein
VKKGHQHDAEEEKGNIIHGISKNFLLPARSSEPGQLDQTYVNKS